MEKRKAGLEKLVGKLQQNPKYADFYHTDKADIYWDQHTEPDVMAMTWEMDPEHPKSGKYYWNGCTWISERADSPPDNKEHNLLS